MDGIAGMQVGKSERNLVDLGSEGRVTPESILMSAKEFTRSTRFAVGLSRIKSSTFPFVIHSMMINGGSSYTLAPMNSVPKLL